MALHRWTFGARISTLLSKRPTQPMLSFAEICLCVLFSSQAFGQGGVWTARAPIPTVRSGADAGLAAVNGKVYAVGEWLANSNTVTAIVEAYDPATDTWTTKSSMPTARYSLRVAVVNGTLYAIGGCTTTDCSGLVATEAYDPIADSWSTKAPMPTARRAFAIGVINGVIYAVGGLQGPGSSGITTNEAYDPATNTWSTKSPMPAPRGGGWGCGIQWPAVRHRRL